MNRGRSRSLLRVGWNSPREPAAVSLHAPRGAEVGRRGRRRCAGRKSLEGVSHLLAHPLLDAVNSLFLDHGEKLIADRCLAFDETGVVFAAVVVDEYGHKIDQSHELAPAVG